MRLSIPLTLLLGLTVLFLIRKDELKISHALLVVLLGFYLSSTTLAGRIGQLDTMIAGLVGGNLGPQ
ncbi:MAG: hypothetical protein ACRDVE_20280 [Actinocrinis sp.]